MRLRRGVTRQHDTFPYSIHESDAKIILSNLIAQGLDSEENL